MRREQYSPEVIAQAALGVAEDPKTGNSTLANRVREVIAAGEDPFHLVFRATKNGRAILELAELIRRQQSNGHIRVK
ncbi:MAG TPA: hypothetical protein VFT49_02065 [Candidatus Saccharimonadales bacterium]|nr:hypothetical protein [Candidatus Saccharimonadales bacterium]